MKGLLLLTSTLPYDHQDCGCPYPWKGQQRKCLEVPNFAGNRILDAVYAIEKSYEILALCSPISILPLVFLFALSNPLTSLLPLFNPTTSALDMCIS